MGCITSRSSEEGEESSRRSPAAEVLEEDDLLSEILLRLPPQPSSLPRASLVCRRWRHLLSDPSFSRRFRIHHRRNPPLLGIFNWCGLAFLPTLESPNRVPPGRFSLKLDKGDEFLHLGSRHGLVLILVHNRNQVLVWDPFTGDQHRIALPPELDEEQPVKTSGAVLRATGDFQHFQVVFVVVKNDGGALACVYSSQTGEWGNLVSTPLASGAWIFTITPAVLDGDSLYWLISIGAFTKILEFHSERQSLALIPTPLGVLHMSQSDYYTVTRAEGSGLGFLAVYGFCAKLWEWKADSAGIVSWVLGRTVDLDNLLSLNSQEMRFSIKGFAEDNNLVFLSSIVGIFMIHLQSLKFKEISETVNFIQYHPFESVYAAGI